MSDSGWNALGTILSGAFNTATGITTTVVGGQNTRAEISAGVETTKDTSNTTRTIIIVAGVAVCVLVGIILVGIFIKKK